MAAGSLKLKFLDFFMRRFLYELLGEAQKIVVHDSILGDRLNKIRKSSIYVIPHGMIDHAEQCDLKNFRKDLGLNKNDFIVLTFGFLTWYKGSDWLVEKFKQYYDKTKDVSIKLVLAGGKSANLQNQKFYEEYYADVTRDLSKYPNIIHTGFVSNEDIHKYYCSSDVVVFPYRTHMSASGPMSFAMSYDRPFLVSDSMSSILNTTDVKDSMEKLKLEKSDLIFKMGKSESLFEKIYELISNKKLLNSLDICWYLYICSVLVFSCSNAYRSGTELFHSFSPLLTNPQFCTWIAVELLRGFSRSFFCKKNYIFN